MEWIFLMCSERSGSNLISKIINSHSHFCSPSPPHLIRTFAQNINNYGDLQNDSNWKILLEDVADIMKYQLGEWKSAFTRDELMERIDSRSLNAVIKYIFMKEAISNGKKALFIKENHIYNFMPYLRGNFPTAKYIYLVRDPRDVCLSWKISPNHPGGVIKASEVWLQDNLGMKTDFENLHQQSKILLVKYEELVAQTEQTVKNICSFLQSGYEPAMLEFYMEEATIRNAKRLKDWENLAKPVMEANYNKYQTGLSEKEIRYIEHVTTELINYHGYKKDFEETMDFETLNHSMEIKEAMVQKDSNQLFGPEKEVRQKRLDTIHRILNRQLS